MGGKKSNHLRKFLSSFKSVRIWQLFLVLIPLAFFTATLLRFDHLEMIKLREAVLAADNAIPVATAANQAAAAASGAASSAEGSLSPEELNANLAQALSDLQSFTYSHIVVNLSETNGRQVLTFGTGPFYLEHSYLRDANAAIAAVENTLASDANPHGNIYEAVRQICQPQAIAHGWAWTSPGYIECWTSELAKYPASDELSPTVIMAAVPSTELYRMSFASPLWAPTPAGFALLVCTLLAIIILIRFLIWAILKLALIFLDR